MRWKSLTAGGEHAQLHCKTGTLPSSHRLPLLNSDGWWITTFTRRLMEAESSPDCAHMRDQSVLKQAGKRSKDCNIPVDVKCHHLSALGKRPGCSVYIICSDRMSDRWLRRVNYLLPYSRWENWYTMSGKKKQSHSLLGLITHYRRCVYTQP